MGMVLGVYIRIAKGLREDSKSAISRNYHRGSLWEYISRGSSLDKYL